MDSIELFRDNGANFRSVRVRVDKDKFCIETQDMGPTVEEVWGDADYEFWTTVPQEAWGELLLAFAQEFLAGDQQATDRLREICKKYDVSHSWQQWI